LPRRVPRGRLQVPRIGRARGGLLCRALTRLGASGPRLGWCVPSRVACCGHRGLPVCLVDGPYGPCQGPHLWRFRGPGVLLLLG